MTTSKKILAIGAMVLTLAGVFFSIWSPAATLHTRSTEGTESAGTESARQEEGEADANFTKAAADLNQLYDEVRAQGLLQ